MGYKLITQVILITTSLVIIFTFIKPSFEHVSATQDELFEYRDAVAKASELNSRLQELIQIENSFSQRELQILETFIPSRIDELQVMSDLNNIMNSNNAVILTLKAVERQKSTQDVVLEGEKLVDESRLEYQDFDISFRASYDQMKEILTIIERNTYLLEVVKFGFTVAPSNRVENSGVDEEGRVAYDMTLRAYSLSAGAE